MGRSASLYRNWYAHSAHPTIGVGATRGVLVYPGHWPDSPVNDNRTAPFGTPRADEDADPPEDETRPPAGRPAPE